MFCLKKTRRTHSTKSVWTVCMFPFLSDIVFNLSLRTFLKQKRLEIRLVEQPFSSEIFYVNLVRFDDFKLAKYIVTFTTRTKKTAKSEHVQKLELQMCTLLGTARMAQHEAIRRLVPRGGWNLSTQSLVEISRWNKDFSSIDTEPPKFHGLTAKIAYLVATAWRQPALKRWMTKQIKDVRHWSQAMLLVDLGN